MVKLVVLLCSIVLQIHEISADDCKELGVKGYYRLFPDLLANGKGHQKVGYHAVIGVNEGTSNKIVHDRFDGLTGKLEIDSKLEVLKGYYYPSTYEAFIIKNGECDSMDLRSNRKRIVSLWSSFDLSTIFNITESLGPTGLLVNFISQQKDIQLIKDISTGFDENSIINKSTNWFTCLPSEGPSINIFLDSSKKLSSMILQTDKETRIPFNYIKLDPLPKDQQEPVTYPYGYGCTRMRTDQTDEVPKFAESSSFKLGMEIAFHYDGKPYAESLHTLSLMRYKGIYSYESLYNNQKVRVIYDPDLSIEYLIYQDTGTCLTTKAMPLHSGYLKWPYSNDSAFNILSPMVLHLRNDDMSYFGQIRSESKLLDIYERKVTPFAITDGQNRSALINYFIPVDSSTGYRAPSQIDIHLNNSLEKSRSITRIKLKITEYVESEDLYDPVRFDLRSCQNEFGQSSWFQIVFSIVPIWFLKSDNKQEILESELREILYFIPMNRLSDIRVGIRGPSLYITSKLSDGPSILYAYEASSNTILTESRTELVRDNEEDCARICTVTSNCKAFSYCDDRKCNLNTGPLPVATNKTTKQCTVYTIKLDHFNGSRNSTKAKLNQFTSSSVLMNQIKLMVDNRKFALTDVGIADEMFVVSSPYEVGGYGDAYEYDHSMTSKLNDYKLLMPGYEIVKTKRNERLTGLSYLDCLYKCENDDDCLTVSYCTDEKGGCTTSSESSETIKLNDKLRNLKSSCSIMSKTFIDFFNRLPGRSLIKTSESAPRKLVDLDREACAKACLDEQSFTCEAFDFCESGKQKSFDCFLRVFHVIGNASDESYSWDSSNTRCDHYTRKLSMDYKQFVGMKLKNGPLITTIEGNSLENCAAACNRAQEECNSFEYCQPFDSISTISSCRLTNRKIIGDLSNMTSASFCSVYGIARTERANRVYLMRGRVSIPLAVLGGLSAFVFGVLFSAFITYCSMRKKKY